MSRTPRRNHAPTFKAKVAQAVVKGEQTLAEPAQQFDVHLNQITTWKAQLGDGASEVFGSELKAGLAAPAIDVTTLHAEIGELRSTDDPRASRVCTFIRGARQALIRVALDRHDAPVSRIVAVALRMLRSVRPDLRLLVSYADAGVGHHGGIYQAGGWSYTGGGTTHAYRINGRDHHPRSVGSAYGKGGQSVSWLRAHVDPDATRVTTGVKHRYLLGFDAEMRTRVAAKARPYPRRAKHAMAGDPPAQRQGGTDPHAPV